MSDEPRHPAQLRWLGASQLLAAVRADSGITRAAAANRLGISSGSATDLLARLRQVRLLDETPAPAQGRGRPTTLLRPHPDGPLVLAADLRATNWRLALADLDGAPQVVAEGAYDDAGLDAALVHLADAIGAVYRRKGQQLSAIGVSAAGTVSDGVLVQFTPRGRRDVDLSVLTSKIPRRVKMPVLLCNDATLAGLAEARSGAAKTAGTSLHLIVATGIGGTLVVNGEPISGAHGAAGEYGHIPLGDPALICPCGARGCWDLTVDGRALARHLREAQPHDPVDYVHRIVSRHRNSTTQRAFETVAVSLGRGIAGLVNLHDPEVVTLGGVGALLREAAPDAFHTAYLDGLMNYRRDSPPPVLDAEHGEEGPLRGAVIMALDDVTSPAGLAKWAEHQSL
ncbi:ROK family protein [Mycolicibacterium goodii]|uniref:ROK family transcriptional regulator n=1 Tax=Mycolicibacterium goodii TaxID=134601 RepID=UPI001F033F68|nr:ROK family transcriptional regulator [Mycolicibacterium goodii]ULN50663.1 ROK family protein [Mycolicibacterium goodii]